MMEFHFWALVIRLDYPDVYDRVTTALLMTISELVRPSEFSAIIMIDDARVSIFGFADVIRLKSSPLHD